jgi:hypothetical protein
MNERKKTIGLIVLCCLLFLFAGARFWSMAADSRQQDETNSRTSPIQQRIVSNVGPHLMKMDPFQDLGLSSEQRRKIDEIINASMPKLPPPGAGGSPGRRHVLITIGPGPQPAPDAGMPAAAQTQGVAADSGPDRPVTIRAAIPIDKIRAILTPEQQRKFDEMHKMPIGSGGPMVTGPAAGGPGGMVLMHRGQDGPQGTP